MTVLSDIRANPGTARILLSELARNGGQGDRAEILGRIAPEGGGDYVPGTSGDARDETVSVCVSFGLVGVYGDDLAISIPESQWDDLGSLGQFRRLVGQHLWTTAASDQDLTTGAGRFAGAIAWFLCQDPMKPVTGFDKSTNDLFDLQQQQLRHDDHFFRTDRPWGSFLRWATFLGFVEELRTSPRHRLFIPDPTVAVRAALDDIDFGAASEAVHSLGRALPVLDYGPIRRRVEGLWRTGEPPRSVSPSLSVALCRLEREGHLAFPPSPDARATDRAVLHLASETRTIAVVVRGDEE